MIIFLFIFIVIIGAYMFGRTQEARHELETKDAIILGYCIGGAEWEVDAVSPLEPEVLEFALQHYRTYKGGIHVQHSSDCTKESHSCIRCQSEVVHQMADTTLNAYRALHD